MGIFGLFKRKPTVMDRTRALMEMDISDIWDLANDDDFVTALDGWVSGKDPETLTAPERAFFRVMRVTQEAASSGFEAWYLSQGDGSILEAPGALRALGFEEAAETASRALELLPEPDPLEESRSDRLETAGSLETLEALAREFNASLADFAAKCRRYAEANRGSFG